MASDTLREKEKHIAGIRKYLVRVAWQDVFDDSVDLRRDMVAVEATSEEEARHKACEAMEDELRITYLDDRDPEETDISEFDVHHQGVYALDELEFPSIL